MLGVLMMSVMLLERGSHDRSVSPLPSPLWPPFWNGDTFLPMQKVI